MFTYSDSMPRPRKKPKVGLTRRTPAQARAKDTVAVIFEATARILERDGRRALNTNLIAQRAGISIGTLYQYFDDKEAILVAMAREQIASDGRAMLDALTKAMEDPEPERVAIRTLISLYERRRTVRRAAVDALVAQGLGHERANSVRLVADVIAERSERLLPGRRKLLSTTAIFVLTRAVNGALRAVLEEDSALLGTPEFEDELVRLVRNYGSV